jgi:hypothetical protein
MLGPLSGADDLAQNRATVIRSWAAEAVAASVSVAGETVVVRCEATSLTKTLTFDRDGTVTALFEWSAGQDAAWFTTELSLGWPAHIETDATARWEYPIETVAKSEKGFDRTVQGTAVALGWDPAAGRGTVRLAPAVEPNGGSGS